MSAAARANMIVQRNLHKKLIQAAKGDGNDDEDAEEELLEEDLCQPDCVANMNPALRDLLRKQLSHFEDCLLKGLEDPGEDQERLLDLEQDFDKLLYQGFIQDKGFYPLDHDRVNHMAEKPADLESDDAAVVEVHGSGSFYEADQKYQKYVGERAKKITESQVFQNFIIGVIVIAGALVGVNTYFDCGFPRYGSCFADEFGTTLAAKRPCMGELELVGLGDCSAKGCCFEAVQQANRTNCWQREVLPECFSGDASDQMAVVIQVVDTIILVVFTFECILKFLAHGLSFWPYFRDGWNVFDLLVVIACYVPNAGNAAVLRLLRLLRLLKLLHYITELQIILSGLAAGMRSLGYILVLMLLVFYVFGIMYEFIFCSVVSFICQLIAYRRSFQVHHAVQRQ